MRLLEKFLNVLNVCGVVLIIELLLLPLCCNINMDKNNIPATKTVVENTRFNYVEELVEPFAVATGMYVTSPVCIVLVGKLEYDLVTNKINAFGK